MAQRWTAGNRGHANQSSEPLAKWDSDQSLWSLFDGSTMLRSFYFLGIQFQGSQFRPVPLSKCDFSCPIWGANIMQILVALVDLTHEHSIRPCSQFMKKIRSSLFTPFMYIYINGNKVCCYPTKNEHFLARIVQFFEGEPGIISALLSDQPTFLEEAVSKHWCSFWTEYDFVCWRKNILLC